MAEQKKKKSWKTTVAGIAAGIGIIASQVTAVLDDDPGTEFSVAVLITALGAMGIGWFSRDKDVSSKSSGVE